MNDIHKHNRALQDIKVSVIVPCYNREKTIKRCIDSIAEQTFPPYEIIAVDDGSADQTLTILENMSYDNLRVVKQNHRGAQAARNLGIINAKGNHIAFLDSDDEWLPQMLEEVTGCYLGEGEDCVIYSDCYVCREKKKKVWRLPDCSKKSYEALLAGYGPTFGSLFGKREWFFEMGLLDENVLAYQEWDTSIRLARRNRFVHLKKPLFIYYLHDGETISKDNGKDISGYAYIVDGHQDEILKMCGIRTLNNHYKILIKKCITYKDRRAVVFALKVLKINIIFIFRKLLGMTEL